MASRFREDDRVRQAKGGPMMTVKGYDDAGRIVCRWHETGKGWQERAFEPGKLVGKYGRPAPGAPARTPADPSAESVPLAAAERVLALTVAEAQERYDGLTARQREVAALMAQGLPNRAIAAELGISPKTLDIHRNDVYQKLRVRTSAAVANIVHLVALAEAATGRG